MARLSPSFLLAVLALVPPLALAKPRPPPKTNRPLPVDLAKLPVWGGGPPPASGAKTIQIRAYDAPADVLVSQLTTGIVILPPADLRVTGQIDAADAGVALTALASAYPAIAVPAPPPALPKLRGKSYQVVIGERRITATRLFAMLRSPMGENLVLAAGTYPDLTVRVGLGSAEEVAFVSAAVLGLTVERRGKLTLIGAPGKLPAKLKPEKGGKLSIGLGGASAAEALALVGTLQPTRLAAPCGGPAIHLDLTGVAPHELGDALAVASGLPVAPLAKNAPPTCAISLVDLDAWRDDLVIVATAAAGKKTVALVRTPAGELRVLRSGHKLVGVPAAAASTPELRPGNKNVVIILGQIVVEDIDRLAAQLMAVETRLAATITGSGSIAVLEVAYGTFVEIHADPNDTLFFRSSGLSPGKFAFTVEDQPPRELLLSRRP